MGFFLLGCERKQSQGKVLSVDGRRPQAVGSRNQPLAANDSRNRPCDGRRRRCAMSWMRFLHRKGSDSELQDEIEAFLTEETAYNEARGMSPEEAGRQARLKFGNAQKVRESLWMQNTPQRLTTIARDVRYALHTLSRTPGFSIIAIVVM